MADRSVSIALEAQVAGFVNGIRTAQRSVSGFMTELDKSAKKRQALDHLGSTAGKVGIVAAAGLGMAVKAAIDWESAWAGVTKTVDGSASQMAELEGGLRDLAKTLPATHTEIAAVAEAAGQLGVQRDSIVAFTRTMIDLGETTNLTADEAATSIAQMMNVMQTAPDEVDNLASTLVSLGNAGASTEADILAMAQRLSGAGQTIGASETDVLALASSMADLGIQAQLGGGAMSRVMLKMYQDVGKGGDSLEAWATLAGQTSQEFADQWSSDPVHALDAVVQGLAETSANGGDVVAVLSELGIKGTENLSVMLRMTGAQDGLSKSLDRGAEAWDQNTALAIEAAKRYDTAASQMQIGWNNVQDAAIEFGEVALPVLATASEKVADFAQAIGGLPQPVKTATTSLLGVTAVVGGGMWLGTKAIGAVSDMRSALDDLGMSAGKTSRAMKGLQGAAALMAGAAAIDAIQKQADETLPGLEDLTRQLIELSRTDVDSSGLSEEFDSLDESIKRLTDRNMAQELQDSIYNFAPFLGSDSAVDEAKAEIEALDQALTNLVANGAADVAAESFKNLGLSADEMGRLKPLLTGYNEALLEQENAAKLAADGAEDNAEATREGGNAAQLAAGQHRDLVKALTEERNQRLRNQNATINYEQSVDDANKAAKENGRTLDITTEKGRANRRALLDLAGAWNEQSGAVRNNRGEQRQAIDAFVKTAGRMGMNEDKARDYAKSLLDIPPKRETWIDLNNVENAMSRLGTLRTWLDNIPRSVTSTIYVNTQRIGSAPGSGGGTRGGVTPGAATGGYVTGPGTPTSDSIPARLSNGEYVVKAAAVDRYGVNFMHDVNAMRFASGGQVGGARDRAEKRDDDRDKKDRDRRERERAKHRAKVERQLDKATDRLTDLRDDTRSLQQAAAGNFRADPFQANATLGGVLRSLQADTVNAREFRRAARGAQRLGLNGQVYRDLLASGNTDVFQAIDSRRDVRRLEAAWATRNAATRNLTVGAFGRPGGRDDTLKEMRQTVDELRKELRKLGDRVERGAQRGTEGKQERERKRRRQAAMRARG